MLLLPTDEQMVEQALAGDTDGFKTLVERHYAGVYRVARSILKRSEDAEDATQEIFVRAYQALPQYSGRGAFGAWLRRLTVNHCINRVQGASARRASLCCSLDLMTDSLAASSEADPEETLIRSEERDRIRFEINQLPASQRAALGLRIIDGLTYEEIASIMDVPVNSVRSWLHRGRARLKCALESEGVNA